MLKAVEGSEPAEVLQVITRVSENMMNRVKAHQIEMGVLTSSASGSLAPSLGGSSVSEGASDDDLLSSEALLNKSRPFNQRVTLPSGDEWEMHVGGEADAADGDVDEEELTRAKVKEASTQIVTSNNKSRRRRAKKQ